ncbi:MAG TPA: DUF4837 family protein [Salinimicrobium sp.]|nr:DUF4837 family protein [Salinimicrobium sp.]
MKKILFFIANLLLLTACEENPKESQVILSDSSGNINNLVVILDNEHWKGEIGEAIRLNLAAPVDGLPQIEPLFDINQMPPEAFQGFVRNSRIFLIVRKGEPAGVSVVEDPYARPQTGIIISGETNEEIIQQIEENSQRIIDILKETEITEQQRRIDKSLTDDSRLEEKLGVSLDFPTSYRYAKEGDDFFWIRKDIPHGSMEIFVYEVPINVIESDTNVIGNIIAMRDSIGKKYIPGPVEGSYMITEEAYAPYLFESEIDGKFAYETKGTWEVENAFMAGPFLNYAIKDEENDRYIILEGSTYAPSATKRDNMFELEAILRSAEFN